MNLKDQVILCLDSACGAGSVAVFVHGECKAFVADAVSGTQAKNLIPMVEQALKESGVGYTQLNTIVSTIGPGSFTGIRIALSSARAFGLALKIPVVGVSTVACLAHHQQGAALAVLNAGKGDVFVQAFDAACHALDEAHMLPASELRTHYPTQHAIGQLSLIGEEPNILPNAQMAGEALLTHLHLIAPPEPFYIRPPDAVIPATWLRRRRP